jgi:hypothetical protein
MGPDVVGGDGWKPPSLAGAGGLAGRVFLVVKDWYHLGDEWTFDVSDVDANPESFSDPKAIAAVCLRKLQLIRFLSRPDQPLPDPWMVVAHLSELQVAMAQIGENKTACAAAGELDALDELVRRVCVEITEHWN